MNEVGTFRLNKIEPILKSRNNAFDTIFSGILITLLMLCIGYALGRFGDHPFALILLSLNGFMAIVGMIKAIRRQASIHFIAFMFCYLFFSLAPIAQVGAASDPVFEIGFILLKASFATFIFTFLGLLTLIASSSFIKNTIQKDTRKDTDSGHFGLLYIMTLVVALISLGLFREGLFTSREGFNIILTSIFKDQAIALVAMNILKLTPFFGAVIGLRAAMRMKRKDMIAAFLFLLLLAVVINNPMTSPRYYLAGIAFFFIDYMFAGQRTRLLSLLLIIGILTAPLFHVFRRDAPIEMPVPEKTLMEDTLLSMDYDGFQLGSYTLLNADKEGLSYGNNLLGAVLFFVPRKLWEDKPPPTSHIIYETMIEYRLVGTNNLSTPLVFEGYYAFAWIGVIGISLIFWWLIAIITRYSWADDTSFMFLTRCIMAGLTLILLRGTLMVAMSAIVGFVIAAALPYIIFNLKRIFKPKSVYS